MSEDLGRGYSKGEDNGTYNTPPRQVSPEVRKLQKEVDDLREQVRLAEQADRLRRELDERNKSEISELLREKQGLEERLKNRTGKK